VESFFSDVTDVEWFGRRLLTTGEISWLSRNKRAIIAFKDLAYGSELDSHMTKALLPYFYDFCLIWRG
jgi:hypothetical protein